jgi:hypothetical protein
MLPGRIRPGAGLGNRKAQEHRKHRDRTNRIPLHQFDSVSLDALFHINLFGLTPFPGHSPAWVEFDFATALGRGSGFKCCNHRNSPSPICKVARTQ